MLEEQTAKLNSVADVFEVSLRRRIRFSLPSDSRCSFRCLFNFTRFREFVPIQVMGIPLEEEEEEEEDEGKETWREMMPSSTHRVGFTSGPLDVRQTRDDMPISVDCPYVKILQRRKLKGMFLREVLEYVPSPSSKVSS